MTDVALVRKRLRQAVELAKRDAALRRERADTVRQQFETFLEETATPVFRTFANALRGEGFPFEVMTPSNALRLVPDRNRDEGLTLELDAASDPPAVLLSVTKGRGNRMTRTEQAVKDGAAPDQITSDDLETLLVDAVKPWLV